VNKKESQTEGRKERLRHTEIQQDGKAHRSHGDEEKIRTAGEIGLMTQNWTVAACLDLQE